MVALAAVRRHPFALLAAWVLVAACGDDAAPSGPADAGRDGSALDLGTPADAARPPGDAARDDATAPGDATAPDDAGRDATPPDDAGPAGDASADDGAVRADSATDAGGPAPDAGAPCAAQDARGEGACEAIVGIFWDGATCSYQSGCRCVGTDCGAGYESLDACVAAHAGCGPGGACARDEDCVAGAEWCVGGACAPCDNSALVCFIACPEGWSTYSRNGCSPCECAPRNACRADADCPGAGERCYAGRFCWEGCAPGDPACCQGNVCSAAGCTGPSPVGCRVAGCPMGQECVTFPDGECTSSSCFCGGESGAWGCTRDCGGGSCRPSG